MSSVGVSQRAAGHIDGERAPHSGPTIDATVLLLLLLLLQQLQGRLKPEEDMSRRRQDGCPCAEGEGFDSNENRNKTSVANGDGRVAHRTGT